MNERRGKLIWKSIRHHNRVIEENESGQGVACHVEPMDQLVEIWKVIIDFVVRMRENPVTKDSTSVQVLSERVVNIKGESRRFPAE